MNIFKAIITIKKLENKPVNVQYSRAFGYIYDNKDDKIFALYCNAYNYLYNYPKFLKLIKWLKII
jgi:hypothetical protein